MKKVGVSKEEKQLSYYKYFQKELAKIPDEKIDILNGGPIDEDKCIPVDKRNLFLAGKDEEYCQCGYGIGKDGTGIVCNTTYMSNVTCEMLDWWFAWQSVGSDLRYKIWDPEDHYFSRAVRVDYVCDENVPMNEKTWGVDQYVMEDIGVGPELLKLAFKRPKNIGLDENIIGTEKCQSLVCACGESSINAVMIHKWYPCKDGIMFCSRFWIGYKEENGQIVKALPEGFRIPVEGPKALFAHCIKEFTNLASILPSLYEEEKDNL